MHTFSIFFAKVTTNRKISFHSIICIDIPYTIRWIKVPLSLELSKKKISFSPVCIKHVLLIKPLQKSQLLPYNILLFKLLICVIDCTKFKALINLFTYSIIKNSHMQQSICYCFLCCDLVSVLLLHVIDLQLAGHLSGHNTTTYILVQLC